MNYCTYCGSLYGETRDHLVPVAFSHPTGRKGKASVSYKDTVPCCVECNSLLGSTLLWGVQARAGYLLGVYQKRYKKLLSQPDWTKEDLEDIGPSLKKNISQAKLLKNEIKGRLEHLSSVAGRDFDMKGSRRRTGS